MKKTSAKKSVQVRSKPGKGNSTGPARTSLARGAKRAHRWSARVTKESDALDLEPNIFESDNPRRIALSLKRSAEKSKRRKSTPLQSSMSMLNFYINRAGKNLSADRRSILEKAKDELQAVFACEKKN